MHGILTTFLYLTSYQAFYFGRISFLSVPISLSMVAWYYFLFHKESKTYAIRLSKSIKLRIKPNIIISACFLAAATMMKYHSVIYAGIFMVVYILYLTIKEIKNHKITHISDIITVMKKSGAWQLGWQFFAQLIIIFILSWWWIKLALIDAGMWERVLAEGAGKQRNWGIGFFFEFIIQTIMTTSLAGGFIDISTASGGMSLTSDFIIGLLFSMSLFIIIPTIMWFRKKEGSFINKNPRLIIYIIVLYITATFLLSNRQFRYMIHVLPFLYIFITAGVIEFAKWLRKKLRFKYALAALAILIFAASIATDMAITKTDTEKFGVYSPSLRNHLSEIEQPSLFLNLKGKIEPEETGYYYTPDLFIFDAMSINKEHNPAVMKQHVSYLDWLAIQADYETVLKQIAAVDEQINTVVVLFKYDAGGRKVVEPTLEVLTEEGFTATELDWYYVLEK